MHRFTLIAYLSLMTVLGPLLCCCSAQRLASHSNVAHSSVNRRDQRIGSQAPCCQKRGSKKQVANGDKSPDTNEHDRSQCPCKDHQVNLVATAVSDAHWKTVESCDQTWPYPSVGQTSLANFEFRLTSITIDQNPTGLYGRELLRAYQILRC